ncbi:MAG: rhodanese-related sulfurtransferase [Alphaproteobacteria bacterium]|nr:MAG: rhodanese-related sulfurtransferase [Alphaproteobacteria bacterium]
MNNICIISFYKFVTILNLEELKIQIENICSKFDTKGTILIAPEGINGTIEGSKNNIKKFLETLKNNKKFSDIIPKYSYSSKDSFNRMKVRLKKEIVTIGNTEVNPNKYIGKYIEPNDWNELISDPNTILIDTRNEYEVAIGTFKGAINPKTKSFRDLPNWIKNNLENEDDDYKNKKIAMFCTGGIRCEKSTSYLVQKGFTNVSHLKGGILKYLENIPKKKSLWDGECFVFDQRVSVAEELKPGSYLMCHGCRMPLKPEDTKLKSYIHGVSCKYCHNKKSAESKKRYADRQKQINLALERGEKHMGSKPMASSTVTRKTNG